MNIDLEPLLSSVERYIAKADKDLEETLEGEGYVNAAGAVEAINKLEEAVNDALIEDAQDFLDIVQEAENVDGFIREAWETYRTSADLETAWKRYSGRGFVICSSSSLLIGFYLPSRIMLLKLTMSVSQILQSNL